MRKEIKRKKAQKLRIKRLIKKYGQWIVARNVWSGRYYNDTTYYDEFTGGWALLWHMCLDEINVELHKHPDIMKEFYFVECKEKFGEMRIYTSCLTDEIDDIIDKYSFISGHVCMQCGKPDTPMTNNGWLWCECKDCFEKNKYHKHIKYEDVADLENAVCPNERKIRRYENGKETIIAYDIKDTVDRYRQEWERRRHK